MRIETRNKLVGMAFISLWLIGFCLFWAFPLGYSFFMSLNQVTIKTDRLDMEFLGVDLYKKALLMDAEIPNVISQFLAQSLIVIPIIVIFALIMALLLNQQFPGRALFRAVFFLPVVLTSGNLINELTSQNQGTISFMQSMTVTNLVAGLGPTWSLVLKDILDRFLVILWYSGIQMLIIIAGMQSINPSVYEASRIDGANSWENLWMITLPGIMPFIFIATVYTVVDQFTVPFNPVLTVIKWHSENPATGYGYASAISWLYFLVILLILGAVFLIFAKSLGLSRKGGKR